MPPEIPRRALVTGATGFVGGHLALALARAGCEVHAIVRATSDPAATAALRGQATLHPLDGTPGALAAAVRAAAPDVVFHLASCFVAEHRSEDVAPLVDANLAFPTQLLEALARNGAPPLVNTGTSWQHYQGPDDPVCLYAATKTAFEAVLGYYVRAEGLRAVTLKLFDTYGPGDRRRKLFALLARAARSGERLAMSAGEQKIDLVHVDDVVRAFIAAAARVRAAPAGAAPESFAVSSGAPIPLRELVAAYERAWGVTLAIDWGARPYRRREVMEPWSRGLPLPGWRPQVALEPGLRTLPDPR
jgi:nucleoside-diphosphate-sugar epimerase